MLSYPWKVALLTAPAACLVLIDITGVSIAVNRIRGSFGTTDAQGTLVTFLYYAGILLANAAEGYLARRYGTRRVWLAGQLGFVAASLLTGLAWDIGSFLVGRLLMGMAAGLLQPVSLSLALTTTARVAPLALVAFLSLMFAGPLLGLPLGGFLSQTPDWRWVFLLNIPLGALWLLLGLAWLDETPTDRTARLDWAGWLLLAMIYVAVALGVADVASSGWRWILRPFELQMLGGAALLLPLLIWWQLRARQPLLDLRLFASVRFCLGVLVVWMALIQVSGVVRLWLSFLLNPLLYGLGEQSTGALAVWAVVGFLVVSPPALIVLFRFGLPPVLISGFLLLLFAHWTLGVLEVGIARRTIKLTMLLHGMGIGLTLVPGLFGLLLGVPPARLGQGGMGMVVLFIRLIPPANIAIVSTVLSLRTYIHYAKVAMQVPPVDLGAMSADTSPKLLAALGQHLASMLAQVPLSELGPRVAEVSPELLTMLVQRSAYMLAIEDTWLFMELTCVVGLLLALTLRWGPLFPPAPATPARQASSVEVGR